jgi:hypothetical protein
MLFVVLAVSPRQASAGAPGQGCSIEIAKEAFPPVDDSFDFLAESTTDPDFEFSIPAGTHTNNFLVPGETVTVSELDRAGWELVEVKCEDISSGFTVFVDDENRVIADCSTNGFAVCTFVNRGPANVPTLSEWGMIAAAAGLGLAGVFFAARKRRAAV